MKAFKRKHDNSVYINLISIFFIFITFIGLAYIIFVMELNFYKKLKTEINNTFNIGTIISYYNNKIHSFDGDDINIIEKNKIDVLELKDEDMQFKTYIYVKDKVIYEYIANINEEFTFGKGQEIFDIKDVVLKKEGKIIELNVIADNENKKKSYIYIQSNNKIDNKE